MINEQVTIDGLRWTEQLDIVQDICNRPGRRSRDLLGPIMKSTGQCKVDVGFSSLYKRRSMQKDYSCVKQEVNKGES